MDLEEYSKDIHTIPTRLLSRELCRLIYQTLKEVEFLTRSNPRQPDHNLMRLKLLLRWLPSRPSNWICLLAIFSVFVLCLSGSSPEFCNHQALTTPLSVQTGHTALSPQPLSIPQRALVSTDSVSHVGTQNSYNSSSVSAPSPSINASPATLPPFPLPHHGLRFQPPHFHHV